MSNYITYEERMEVENCLFNGKSFGEIAKVLGKDRSTISREVRKHSVIERSSYGANGYNACVHRDGCTKVHVCSGSCTRQSLKYCKMCNSWTIAPTLKNRYALQDSSHLTSVIPVPSVTDAPLKKRYITQPKPMQRRKRISLNLAKV